MIWIKGGETRDKTLVLRCSEAHDRASGAGIICVEHHKSGCRQDSQWREHAMGVWSISRHVLHSIYPIRGRKQRRPSLNIETRRIGSACCACVDRWPVIGGDANPLPGHASKAPAPLAHPCARGALGFSTRVLDALRHSPAAAQSRDPTSPAPSLRQHGSRLCGAPLRAVSCPGHGRRFDLDQTRRGSAAQE